MNLDLTELHVTDLTLQTSTSSTALKLPANAGTTRAYIEAGTSAVDIDVPPGVAATIHAERGMSSLEVDSGRFPRIGAGYKSPDYETAANRADIRVATGMGSVSVH